jgi:3'-5' exonuclease
MIKSVKDRVWAFDAEWVPDPVAGRVVYGIDGDVAAPEPILQEMWERGGATEEDPTPFLKLIQCRVVSIAAIERRVTSSGEVLLHLMSLPRRTDDPEECRESRILATFLEAVGTHHPQLVGFNSIQSDLNIFVQRGTVLGVRAEGFSRRPNKPWEGIDYFVRGSEWNVDLRDAVGGMARGGPSLHELAVQSGVPGKMDVDGNQVARLWLDGRLAEIVAYNEYDALTTYLVWLRVAHFAGHFTTEQYAAEQQLVRALIERETPSRPHLARYVEEWDRLAQELSRHSR